MCKSKHYVFRQKESWIKSFDIELKKRVKYIKVCHYFRIQSRLSTNWIEYCNLESYVQKRYVTHVLIYVLFVINLLNSTKIIATTNNSKLMSVPERVPCEEIKSLTLFPTNFGSNLHLKPYLWEIFSKILFLHGALFLGYPVHQMIKTNRIIWMYQHSTVVALHCDET